MKITALLLLAFCLQVSAISRAQNITLSERKAPLEKVLSEIRQQSGYLFFYNQEWMKTSRTVDIEVKNGSLEQVLNATFANQPYSYEIVDKTIVLKLKKQTKVGASVPILVAGHVADSTGTALPNATVKIVGQNKGIQTDKDGNFSFFANIGDRITVSFVGYNSSTFTVTEGIKAQNIMLYAIAGKLQEVSIVVSNGYQTIAKERSVGSFAKPDMNIINDRSTSMNILQRLDGLVPGLTINNAPGQSQYLIRGATTISNSTSPLYVVDGVQSSDVSYINPQDVADVNILKDATAASIWGARAANGVIVVTTKKGNRGDKLKVNYDAFANFEGKPNINYFPVLSSQQFIQAAKETFDPIAYPYANVSVYPTASAGLAPHEVILYNQYLGKISSAQANNSLDSLASINNNQQIKNMFYRNAFLMNHTLSLSGGQKNYAVYGSLSYTDNQSYSPGQSSNTYKINLRQDFNIADHLQLYLITDLTNNVTNSPRNISPIDQFYPYQLFQDNAGNNLSMPYMMSLSDATRMDYQTRSRINLDYNPLNEVNYGYTKNDLLLSRNVFGVTLKILDGLSFAGTYGFNKGVNRTRDYDDLQSYGVRAQIVQFTVAPTTTSTPIYYVPTTGGNYAVTTLNQDNWTIRNQLNYNKNWKDGLHQLTLLAGQEAQEQYSVTNFSKILGWNPALQVGGLVDYKTLASGIAGVVYSNRGSTSSSYSQAFFTQSEVLSRFTSYFANAAYTYNHRYTINGSYRNDQSNNFGLDKSAQNRPIYSAGAKWLISEESFMKTINWVNSLGVRTTYGITGNAPTPGTAASYDIIVAQSSSFLPNNTGLQIATPANRKLTWERTATVNLGLDFALFQNRIFGAIDLYDKKTTDLLGNVALNGFTGYPTVLGNLGNLENKGIELSLTTINIRANKFGWTTTINGAYNRNVITSLNTAAPITTGSGLVNTNFSAGYGAYAIFAYQYAGLDNLGDPQIRLANGTVAKARNISTPADIKYMGTAQPVYSGGISNNFSYGSFRLGLNAIFNLGNVMRRDVDDFYTGRLSHLPAALGGFATGNVNSEFLNRWRQSGDELTTNVPSFIANNTLSTTRRDVTYYTYSDINVVSAAFLKLRDITISYSIPQLLAKKMFADQVTLRAQVNNLMLWKANKFGIDPEFQSNYTGFRNLPSNQGTVTFGINARF